jgi:quinol monooxygenase YgiN
MQIGRREFVGGSLALTVLAAGCALGQTEEKAMYGLIGRFTAVDGKRDELIGYLLEGLKNMPGCLSYIVSSDPAEPNAIWITEAWLDAAAHEASLSLPSVQAAIQKARPIIARMESVAETQPVGGHGLSSGG